MGTERRIIHFLWRIGYNATLREGEPENTMNYINRFRTFILVLIDIVLVNAAVYISLLLRFEGTIPLQYIDSYFRLLPFLTIITIACLIALKQYNRIWEYASINEMLAILSAVSLSMVIVIIAIYTLQLPHFPRSIYLISWILMFLFISCSRISWRVFRDLVLRNNNGHQKARRVLIVGAGDAGAIVAREMINNVHLNLKAVGFIDDDPSKRNKLLSGIPVVGTRRQIPGLVEKMEIDEIIIAMPSVTSEVVRELVDICRKTPAKLRILPGVYESTMKNPLAALREIQMEDLLKREPVNIDLHEIAGYLTGKTVLITGGGGSIGSEMCRQAVEYDPAHLIIVDNCENNLFDIQMELSEYEFSGELHIELVDVKNRPKLETIFARYKPQVIFHAAAYKHVPLMESHPEEALQNNVFGTKNVAEMADKYGTEIFILVSTDKAVNPSSVMGATKRIAELVIKDINRNSKTRFAAVRFGNVLGSRGSVIPTFINQIAKGGPVTVTHPDMVRFFMTIPEAVQLVFQAGALAEGGEIFVLDMGDPVKINDLARDLITISGYEPGVDIEITYTGIRPGEKLYEELFTDREGMSSTRHERIFISKKQLDENYIGIRKNIAMMTEALFERKELVRLIKMLVPEFRKQFEEEFQKQSAARVV
jgi:FlaA1/EpsC-like NDP-sugar epimerase